MKEKNNGKKSIGSVGSRGNYRGRGFAEEKTANVKKSWLSGEASLVGAGARYEFMINEKLSVGVNAYWTSLFFFFNDTGVNVVGRFYPWGKTFYAGLELGLGIHSGIEAFKKDGETLDNSDWVVTRTGFDIVPADFS